MTIKIAEVVPFMVHPRVPGKEPGSAGRRNWLFVKVVTDDGTVGWGEAYTQADRELTVQAHIIDMTRYLIGRDASAIRHLTWTAFNDFAVKRASMEFFSALSAVEMALWDIKGKAVGQPVYQLLGGACRGRIRAYANGWADAWDKENPAILGKLAKRTIALGFTALKVDPFPNPWREILTKEQERIAVSRVAAIREAVGPDIDILVDAHRRMVPAAAVRVCELFEEFDLFWFEEPTPSRMYQQLKEIRGKVKIPIVGGEELYGKHDFAELLAERCVDYINPDVSSVGGILEMQQIATMAEASGVLVAPHGYTSPAMALAATLHVAASIPNFLIMEYFMNWAEIGAKIGNCPVPRDGFFDLPTGSGLGMELDEEAMREMPYQPFYAKNWRSYDEE